MRTRNICRESPLIREETELHLRLPVRKADDWVTRQAGIWPDLRVK